jgi:hypothetical protein
VVIFHNCRCLSFDPAARPKLHDLGDELRWLLLQYGSAAARAVAPPADCAQARFWAVSPFLPREGNRLGCECPPFSSRLLPMLQVKARSTRFAHGIVVYRRRRTRPSASGWPMQTLPACVLRCALWESLDPLCNLHAAQQRATVPSGKDAGAPPRPAPMHSRACASLSPCLLRALSVQRSWHALQEELKRQRDAEIEAARKRSEVAAAA